MGATAQRTGHLPPVEMKIELERGCQLRRPILRALWAVAVVAAEAAADPPAAAVLQLAYRCRKIHNDRRREEAG
jgi:hypothetical protein